MSARSASGEYWYQLFNDWAQKAYWHPGEAAALSLRLDPEYFRFVSPTELDTSEEYEIYRERIDLIERLQRSRNEQIGPSPKSFLDWALSIQLEIPEDLKREQNIRQRKRVLTNCSGCSMNVSQPSIA
jgi:hypothetical protein